MNDKQLEKWLAKQKEINKDHITAMKIIRNRKGYRRGEKQQAIKDEKEIYLQSLQKAKQEILGR